MPHPSWRPLAAVILASLSLTAPARAQDWVPTGLTLTWENDFLAGTDRHYTNGAELAIQGRVPRGALSLFDGAAREWRLSLGQQIYTPERLDARAPVLNDRPYAGWLHLGLSLSWQRTELRVTERMGLDIGVVGPAAAAKKSQAVFHALTGSSRPQGWANQLRDEPTFRLTYACEIRILRERILGLACELSPKVAVGLGTPATTAAFGAEFRVGRVPNEFGGGEPPPVALYLSLSAEGRAVGYDLFLDGNLLRSGGPRVEKRWLVGELSVGVTLLVRGALQIRYVHTYRTPQFDGQGSGDMFGSLSVTLAW